MTTPGDLGLRGPQAQNENGAREPPGMTSNPVWRWIDYHDSSTSGRQFRWSYLPPLMVYLAAGVSRDSPSIAGTFFIKDYLGLSAAFLGGLRSGPGSPGR